MTKLFNKEDILTSLTVDKAKIGDKGYFGDTLKDIETSVECGEVYPLVWIDRKNLSVYSFKNNFFEDHFALFLPADKVKKEPTYRPIKTIDELYNFLVSSVVVDDYNTLDKVVDIFSLVFELKGKDSGYIYFRKFSRIYSTNNAIVLDDCSLDYYFQNYEIKKDDEFVPFGIKVEEQDSERNKDKDVDNYLSDYMDKRIKEVSEED